MNSVTLSGTLMGGFTRVGNNNNAVLYTVVTRRGGNSSEVNEFTVVTYGQSADFLEQHAKTGDRLVLSGRIGRENLGDTWVTVISANQILSVSSGSSGYDVATAVVGGLADVSEVKQTKNGKMFLGINVKAEHTFKQQTFTTFVDVTAWSEVAQNIINNYVPPLTQVEVVAVGNLIPSSYTDRNGNDVSKVGVWADSVIVAGERNAAAGGGFSEGNSAEDVPEGDYVNIADDDLPF